MKLSKYEAREYRKNKMAHHLQGSGLYVYRNASKADLMLPKPAKNGVKMVAPGQEFEGDSYFLQMVKTNEIRLVKTLITPEQEVKQMNEEKLILDQPDIVTVEGKTEHVVVNKDEPKPLNEVKPCCGENSQSKEVLINEDPMDGVDILG